MIRPFDLLDVPLIAQLEGQGTPLSSDALTRGVRPLQAALAGFFSLHSRGEYTVVMPAQNGPAAFAQMRPRKTVPRATVTYIAPALASGNGDVWTQLLESLANAAGGLGLQQLVAEVAEDGPEITALHRVGFAIFLRQDILRFKGEVVLPAAQGVSLRASAETDLWGIQQLYLNTVPRLAQQAEMLPHIHHSNAARGYVLEENEVIAYLEIRRGAAGALFNTIIHPQAEHHARDVILQGLALLGPRWSLPVYCCVRRYQEWLWEPLESLGFESSSSTAVMVKRLVVSAAEPERAPAHVLVQSKVTTPIVHSQH